MKGRTDVVKELISAGCDKNLPDKVKQMTPLPFALALRPFPAGLAPSPTRANLNLQYWFRLLLESLNYQLLFVLLLRNSKYHETKVPNLLYVYVHNIYISTTPVSHLDHHTNPLTLSTRMD